MGACMCMWHTHEHGYGYTHHSVLVEVKGKLLVGRFLLLLNGTQGFS